MHNTKHKYKLVCRQIVEWMVELLDALGSQLVVKERRSHLVNVRTAFFPCCLSCSIRAKFIQHCIQERTIIPYWENCLAPLRCTCILGSQAWGSLADAGGWPIDSTAPLPYRSLVLTTLKVLKNHSWFDCVTYFHSRHVYFTDKSLTTMLISGFGGPGPSQIDANCLSAHFL